MQDKNKMSGPDFLTAIVFILSGIAVCAAASQMRVFRTLLISPGLFPMILGGIFIACGLVMLGIAFRRGGLERAKTILSAPYLRQAAASPRFKRGGAVFLLILAYVALFGNDTLARLNFSFIVGNVIIPVNTSFILITFGYLFATFLYLKAMSARKAALVSGVTSLVIFYVFSKGFGIPIP